MAESYTDNEMRGLLKEESITPQPIAPPIVDPPPIEVVPYTQLDAVREVALKFDPGKPGHNNPGNTNWSPRIQNELGDRVTKGDTYIDNAGVQRWVAKFDTPDTGQQEMNGVTARIWEESGYDPTKFAETYTGTRPLLLNLSFILMLRCNKCCLLLMIRLQPLHLKRFLMNLLKQRLLWVMVLFKVCLVLLNLLQEWLEYCQEDLMVTLGLMVLLIS